MNEPKTKKKPSKAYNELDQIEQSTDWDGLVKPKTATHGGREHPFQGSANQKKNLMAAEWDIKPKTKLGGSRTSQQEEPDDIEDMIGDVLGEKKSQGSKQSKNSRMASAAHAEWDNVIET